MPEKERPESDGEMKDKPQERSPFTFYETLLQEYDDDPRVLAGINAARQLAKSMETEKR